jgi:succinylarginine dihydrolase
VQTVLGEWLSGDNPLQDICYVDLSQSMANGGDPACLRLRVVLTPQEEASVAPDLGDPSFPEEIYAALDELSAMLGLGNVYPFQQ